LIYLSSAIIEETTISLINGDDQNINNMVNALENTESIFTIKAIVSLLVANIAKNAPRI
jgi:hypothetical protein